jgi:hypothetical protein
MRASETGFGGSDLEKDLTSAHARWKDNADKEAAKEREHIALAESVKALSDEVAALKANAAEEAAQREAKAVEDAGQERERIAPLKAAKAAEEHKDSDLVDMADTEQPGVVEAANETPAKSNKGKSRGPKPGTTGKVIVDRAEHGAKFEQFLSERTFRSRNDAVRAYVDENKMEEVWDIEKESAEDRIERAFGELLNNKFC